MRKGLGRVDSLDGRLVWTFTAPHLGYWMAASLTPPSGARRWNLLCTVSCCWVSFVCLFVLQIKSQTKINIRKIHRLNETLLIPNWKNYTVASVKKR